jgi:hypothetical protein
MQFDMDVHMVCADETLSNVHIPTFVVPGQLNTVVPPLYPVISVYGEGELLTNLGHVPESDGVPSASMPYPVMQLLATHTLSLLSVYDMILEAFPSMVEQSTAFFLSTNHHTAKPMPPSINTIKIVRSTGDIYLCKRNNFKRVSMLMAKSKI